MSVFTEGKTKAYQAFGVGGCTATAQTPRAAALKFFQRYPGKRKCSVTQGWEDGQFFTVIYGRTSEGDWPQHWKDITFKTAQSLPDTP